jgi:Tfp pilus assembly protein PilO
MIPAIATLAEVISIAGAAVAALTSAFAAIRKIQARAHLSKELSTKYQDLVKDYESASLEEKREKIVELNKQLSLLLEALPKGERGVVASALEQPSESGRSRYTEQVMDEAVRLEHERSATSTKN